MKKKLRPRARIRAARKAVLASPDGLPARVRPGAVARLQAELAQARRRIEELTAAAERDFLLDIPNRRGFMRELNRAIDFIKRYDTTGAMIMFDVDGLKPINDSLGHGAGDQLLDAVARTLTRQVRSSDVVGRLGGDEFGVLLWNLDAEEARAKAAELERAIDAMTLTFGERTIKAGASGGIAMLDHASDASDALDQADRAMYRRKAERRQERALSQPV